MKIDKRIAKTFVLQKNQSDCGVACLSSIIKFHGGVPNLEKLRIASGTSKQGTTLLGLYQVANSIGFNAEGMQADVAFLREINQPVILHVVVNGSMLHYVVCYKVSQNSFLIGDPALGLKWMNEAELLDIWKSGKLLTLVPDEKRFKKEKTERSLKWDWFKKLLREDLSLLTTILLMGIAVAVLGLATAVFAQVFIDRLIPSGNATRIYAAIGLVSILLTARLLIGYYRQQLMLRQGVDINVRITGSFFADLLMLPMGFFTSRKIGDMVARLNDIGRIQQTVSFFFGELLINVLVVVVSLAAVFLYNIWVGLILLMGVPLFVWVAYRYNRAIINGQRDAMMAYSLNESSYINTIGNIQPIKSFRKETFFTRVGLLTFRFFQDKVYHIGSIGITVQLLTGMIGLAITIGVIILSAIQLQSGQMSTGVFMAVFSLSGTILPALASIAFANVQLQGARIAFERMYEFSSMDKECLKADEVEKERTEKFQELCLQDVSFRYPGRGLLLENINFSVRKGEHVTIFGDNGTGKSTLISLIQRFYSPESGKLLINGKDAETYSIQSYRGLIGVVPQDVTLTNATLLANITLSDSEKEALEAVETLNRYGLVPFFEKFPQGFHTMLGEGGVQISGGQKQLVGLARALVCKPQLLLLDELTAHMDRSTENFVLELLAQLKTSMGILSITHSIRNASVSDRIIVLSGSGQVEIAGNHNELLKSQNLYSAAWQSFTKTH
ncbi:MAG TPA: peptidase domain-containing ABC transporter [Tenuifilum sp.]|uniref:peptidase domain-containing ABC transporter n=1 Tax=Tenuifilum sp. TaxID=2760880 RepID=UPI002CD02ECB|nr:peptidase domain-containing ABC transporter [Tenuifilum sp.]